MLLAIINIPNLRKDLEIQKISSRKKVIPSKIEISVHLVQYSQYSNTEFYSQKHLKLILISRTRSMDQKQVFSPSTFTTLLKNSDLSQIQIQRILAKICQIPGRANPAVSQCLLWKQLETSSASNSLTSPIPDNPHPPLPRQNLFSFFQFPTTDDILFIFIKISCSK